MSWAAPQHIPYGVGCVVEMYVPVRPAATQTVACYTGDGASVFTAQTATLESINTTISAAAAAGARSITVTSANNITTGCVVTLSNREDVLVKSVSSTTVTLRSPLVESHAINATCRSHRVHYTVTAAQAATLFWDGRLEWVIDSANTTKAVYNQACCCSKYPFQTTMATYVDLADEEPQIAAVLDDEIDVSRLLMKGAEDVRKRLDAITQGRSATYVAPVNFTDAVVFAALMRHYRSQRDDVMFERYREAVRGEIDLLLAGAVYRDADQDGKIEENEQRAARSVQLVRA
jgi:hypothetical protein